MQLFSFPSHTGTGAIHGVNWPVDAPRAVVQVSHGMQEYIERYAPLASFLNAHGYAVIGSDHAGHGHSVQQGGVYGYFGETNGWRDVVADLHEVYQVAKQTFPGAPHVILGHSMGSFLARAYTEAYAAELAGAVYVGTSGPVFGTGLGRLLASLLPSQKPSPLLAHMAFGAYNKRFAGKTELDWLSANEQNVADYIADPLCGLPFTAGGFRELFGVLGHVNKKAWAQSIPHDLPVLFIAGADDPVGQYGEGVRKIAQRLRDAGVQDVYIQLYEGMRHEIFNEAIRELVFQDLLDWLDAHFDPAA